ncbi:MAG TPA: potassium channel family protein [Candidatus Binatia bacterium]|nr:potassium channel family protein [Candidatus Binatia bacterium]
MNARRELHFRPAEKAGIWLWGRTEGMTAFLVVLVLSIFVLIPLGQVFPVARPFIDLGFTFILVSGATVVVHRRRATVAIAAFALTNLVLQWLWYLTEAMWLLPWLMAFLLIYCGILSTLVFAQVFSGPAVTRHHVQGAIAGYLLLGLTWAFAYRLVEFFHPGAIQFAHPVDAAHGDPMRGQLVYFSFITLTTVGYGDATPIEPIARTLAILEALTGQLFPAVLLARLVSLEVYEHTTRR